jgi:hypothetical protein
MNITVLTASIPRRKEMLINAIESVANQELKPVAHKIVSDINHNGNHWSYQQLLSSVETEWLCFLDDDDILYPDHLSKLSQYCSDYDVIFSNGNCNDPLDIIKYSDDFSYEYLNEHCIVPITALVRTEAMRKVGGFDQSQDCDYKMWKKLASEGYRFKKIQDITWEYRFHNNNYSRKGMTWDEL